MHASCRAEKRKESHSLSLSLSLSLNTFSESFKSLISSLYQTHLSEHVFRILQFSDLFMLSDPSLQMDTQGTGEARVVLTSPLSLDRESDVDYRAQNFLQRVFSLLKNVRLGSDLTRFQLSPLFNIPKSQLQCYGEIVYCVNNNILRQCANGTSSLDRFISVVAWSISTTRPLTFGVAPYNPILGETHHVSMGTLNVLLEQVSHHPPISALHATDEKENMELIWCHHLVPKFYGTSIVTEVRGKRELKLLKQGESYVMNSPNLLIRLFPVPDVEWDGKVRIRCQETGLEAELCYGGNSFLCRRSSHRSIKGKIFESSSLKTIYKIDGHWDRVVSIKDTTDGKPTVIYNAKEVISGLKTPTVKDPKGVWGSESAVVWSEVSQGILSKDWEKAREAKKGIEEKERESRGEAWFPKHFTLNYNKDSGLDCSPLQKWVSAAPIVVPL